MEEIVMSSEAGEMLGILGVLVGSEFSRDEIEDALALLLLNTIQTSGELPEEPELSACLEKWRQRVFHETRGEDGLDFFARVERYLERHPPKAELIAALQHHFEQRQSSQYERDRARSQQFLAMPMARMATTQKPASGKSWLQVRVSTCTPKT